jgi:hypothetical protein
MWIVYVKCLFFMESGLHHNDVEFFLIGTYNILLSFLDLNVLYTMVCSNSHPDSHTNFSCLFIKLSIL